MLAHIVGGLIPPVDYVQNSVGGLAEEGDRPANRALFLRNNPRFTETVTHYLTSNPTVCSTTSLLNHRM